MSNKYQEALNNVKRVYVESDHYDEEDIRLLQELIDKETKINKEITTSVSGAYTFEVPNEKPANDSIKLFWGD